MPLVRKERSNASLFRLVLLHCFLPLLMGGAIYSFVRPQTWLTSIVGAKPTLQLKQPLLQFLSGVLPDFLWGYSFAFALHLINPFEENGFCKAAIFSVFILLISEVIQLYLPEFTFDIWDAGLLIAAAIIATLQAKRLLYETL